MRIHRWTGLAILALALLATAAAAQKKGRSVDLVFTAPDFASRGIESVTMFPVATYNKSLEAEKLVASLAAQALKGAGYRWVSAPTARELLQGQGGDSLIKVVKDELLRAPRLDSLRAPGLCARLRTDAVLTLRVDTWEQIHMEWNQAGKPSTTVQIKAALVDSSGRLLWSASGSETGEGPYHDPNTNPLGVTSGALGTQPITGQGGPPAFAEVVTRLFARWAPQFPAKATAATTP